MEISKLQQPALIDEIVKLTDENLDNSKVLEHSYNLAVWVFDLLNQADGDDYSVGFNLQDYAYNRLHASRGGVGAAEWAEDSKKSLIHSMKLKFGSADDGTSNE